MKVSINLRRMAMKLLRKAERQEKKEQWMSK